MRSTRGPFPELQGLAPLALAAIPEAGVATEWETGLYDDEIAERMDLVNAALANAGCNCNSGPRDGRGNPLRSGRVAVNGELLRPERDSYFGADMSQLVMRTLPHTIWHQTPAGLLVPEVTHILLETLEADVDEWGEVCAWIYQGG